LPQWEDTSGIDFGHTWASSGFAKPMLSMLSAFAKLERDRIAECIRDAKRHQRTAVLERASPASRGRRHHRLERGRAHHPVNRPRL